jgi:hypothetical protein
MHLLSIESHNVSDLAAEGRQPNKVHPFIFFSNKSGSSCIILCYLCYFWCRATSLLRLPPVFAVEKIFAAALFVLHLIAEVKIAASWWREHHYRRSSKRESVHCPKIFGKLVF